MRRVAYSPAAHALSASLLARCAMIFINAYAGEFPIAA